MTNPEKRGINPENLGEHPSPSEIPISVSGDILIKGDERKPEGAECEGIDEGEERGGDEEYKYNEEENVSILNSSIERLEECEGKIMEIYKKIAKPSVDPSSQSIKNPEDYEKELIDENFIREEIREQIEYITKRMLRKLINELKQNNQLISKLEEITKNPPYDVDVNNIRDVNNPKNIENIDKNQLKELSDDLEEKIDELIEYVSGCLENELKLKEAKIVEFKKYIDEYHSRISDKQNIDNKIKLSANALLLDKKIKQLENYNKEIERNPDDAEAWYNKGVMLGELNRLDEALKAYDKAIEIKPDDANAWFNKGVVLGELNRPDEELKAYDKAIEIKPDDADAWFNKGVVLGELNRFDEALKAFNKAIKINPDYADA